MNPTTATTAAVKSSATTAVEAAASATKATATEVAGAAVKTTAHDSESVRAAPGAASVEPASGAAKSGLR
jgi:hypothetical protein